MKCPHCATLLQPATTIHNPDSTRRRYHCGCGHRFSTLEAVPTQTETERRHVGRIARQIVEMAEGLRRVCR